MTAHAAGGVLVTGAGSGIGLEVVRALLREHEGPVWAVARDGRRRLASESADAVDRLRIIDCDLLHTDSIETIVNAVGRHRLVGLVNNAAILRKAEVGAYDRAALMLQFETNAVVPLLLAQALAPRLAGDPAGHVVHIGSMGGFQDSVKFPGLAGYSASKAALACMAQCLAEEWKGMGLCSNCLALGAADTEMLRQAFPDYRAPCTAAEMGGFIAAFVRNGHKHFNGKVLPVSVSTP